jgi:hypothetical protein
VSSGDSRRTLRIGGLVQMPAGCLSRPQPAGRGA